MLATVGAESESIFLGYRVKRPWSPPHDQDWGTLEFACNVGDDLSDPPEGWVERWDWNRAACYATPEAAWASAEDDPDGFRLFAYWLWPYHLSEGTRPRLASLDDVFSPDFPALPSSPDADTELAELGFDVVEASPEYMGYGHSPLITSGFGATFGINRYGLIADRENAILAGKTIQREMPEHAPFWMIHVFGQNVDDLGGCEPTPI